MCLCSPTSLLKACSEDPQASDHGQDPREPSEGGLSYESGSPWTPRPSPPPSPRLPGTPVGGDPTPTEWPEMPCAQVEGAGPALGKIIGIGILGWEVSLFLSLIWMMIRIWDKGPQTGLQCYTSFFHIFSTWKH